MNMFLHTFHRTQVSKATDLAITLAAMLLLGKIPKTDKDSMAGAREALANEYAPWLMPCINESEALKLAQAKITKDCKALEGEHREVILGILLSGLMLDHGGILNLNKSADKATKDMETMSGLWEPMLQKIDELIEPNDPEIREVIESLIKAGEPITTESVEAALKDLLPEGSTAKIGVITLSVDGTIEGDLENAPQEIKDLIAKLQTKVSERKLHSVN
jgi:hypothetical protein